MGVKTIKIKKHSGDKNNSVGPGQYDNYYNQKNEKIGIIDWNKSIHRSINKKKEKEKEKNTKCNGFWKNRI